MKDIQQVVHQVPQWMNDAFLHQVIQSIVREKDLKIESSSFAVVSKSNDSFASPMIRAKVTVSSKLQGTVHHSFVLKIPSPQRPVHEDSSFSNEIRFYNSTLEEMHRLLKHSGDSGVELGPRVIHCSSGVNAVIVLEDLAALNFRMPTQLLTINQTISTVYKLAKWHAVSIFMAKDNQDLQYNTGLFNKKYSEQLAFMYENFVYFIDDIAIWDGYKMYAKKFAALKNEFFVRGQKVFSAKRNGFNVLNHGDLNLKNLLVREDDAGINVKFVDYQFCVWATPAIDLFYLLHLVVAPDVRVLRKNDLIQFYYKEMVGSLKKLGYLAVPPTLLDLQLELLENGFLEVIITTCLLPFYSSGYLQREISLENIGEMRKSVYSNEQYRSLVKAQLQYFLHKGFLD